MCQLVAHHLPYPHLDLLFRTAHRLDWPLENAYLVGKNHGITPPPSGLWHPLIEPQQLSTIGQPGASQLPVRRPVLYHNIHVLQFALKLGWQTVDGLPHQSIKSLSLHGRKPQFSPPSAPPPRITLPRGAVTRQMHNEGRDGQKPTFFYEERGIPLDMPRITIYSNGRYLASEAGRIDEA